MGALGYVDAAFELAEQAQERDLRIDHVVVTTGSCTTHAGLAVGFAALEQEQSIEHQPGLTGVSVYQKQEGALATVRQKAHETAELIGLVDPKLEERIVVTDDYLGGGYGEPTEGMVEAVSLAARLEGLLIDPVYTGKTLAGLVDFVRRGRFDGKDNVVFWHTGGTPALFAYGEALTRVAGAVEP